MKGFFVIFQITLLVFLYNLNSADSHGRLMKPIARGSRWRFNNTAPKDYNDNEGFCGGFSKQWSVNDGKCGLCGNDFSDTIPRAHEIGGTYGEGIIVENYEADSKIDVSVLLTANHKGYFIFDLCNLDLNNESEYCFNEYPLELNDGGYKYEIKALMPSWFNTTVNIPDNLTCNHCVFRWTYIAGNSWGVCPDKSEAVGCGPQENFRGCADVSITRNTRK